ncbi:MAG: DUF5606 domain-containing protein [Muribaculaceae bacterium]|nr:DUF5606 domain-containing protein [Muribaculaceae bacterium]
MLRQIISITGKPGLYKILSQGNRNIIVEDISTKRRMPVQARDRVVSLGDIAMYTEEEDLPLAKILDRAYKHYEGATVDVKSLIADGRIRDEFALIVPDFDRDRVYDNDLKKFFTWYNLLTEAGYKDFEASEGKTNAATEPAEGE